MVPMVGGTPHLLVLPPEGARTNELASWHALSAGSGVELRDCRRVPWMLEPKRHADCGPAGVREGQELRVRRGLALARKGARDVLPCEAVEPEHVARLCVDAAERRDS